MKKIIFSVSNLFVLGNLFCYTVTIENLLDTQIRVTTEYQNPQLCPPFTFDVPANTTVGQKYIDDCCFTKMTVVGKNKSYFQFGTGACEDYHYTIRPKSSNDDFFIDRESGKLYNSYNLRIKP